MKTTALLLLAVLTVPPALAGEIPVIKGWESAGEVMNFSPATLWEHINGAAETFIQYGFQELSTGEFSKDGVVISVGINDMGTALNAYGIYRTEAPEGSEVADIGGQAIISPPYQCLLVKDRFYVKVDVYDGELDDTTGREVVTAIADGLPGSNGMPGAFSQLPSKDRVPGSERFTREAFLGLRELTNCVSAEYKGPGDAAYRVFSVLARAGEDSDAAWKALEAKWTAPNHEGAPVLTREIPYTGLVGVTKTNTGIIGVVGAENETALIKQLSEVTGGD